jgi:hypothetical protein
MVHFRGASEVFGVSLIEGEIVVMGPFTSPFEIIQAVLSARER